MMPGGGTSRFEGPRELLEPNWRPTSKRDWPLEKLGKALGLPRLGAPHLDRIAIWAIAQPELPLNDGEEIIMAYLAVPENLVDQLLFFGRALEIGGYFVGKELEREETCRMCDRMTGGWLETAPGAVLQAVNELYHPPA